MYRKRKLKKQSLYQAIALLEFDEKNDIKEENKRKEENEIIEEPEIMEENEVMKINEFDDTDPYCKIAPCTEHYDKPITTFSKNLVLSEIRSHIARRDWDRSRSLLLILLHCFNEIEPIVWRYIFIISLYSTTDNLFCMKQLFNACIGSRNSETNKVLKRLIQLPKQ